jgi:hypothetical protein
MDTEDSINEEPAATKHEYSRGICEAYRYNTMEEQEENVERSAFFRARPNRGRQGSVRGPLVGSQREPLGLGAWQHQI